MPPLFNNFRSRLASAIAPSATKATGTGPFIGPGDMRYDTFMGIGQAVGRMANTPQGRIEIANAAIWVHACVQARSNSMRNVPLKLKRAVPDGIDETIEDHPILELLSTVNPFSESEASFRVAIEQSLSIHGRYQVLKVRNDAGVVKELYGLPTQFATPIPDPRRFIRAFRYRVGSNQSEYDPKDVIYFRYPPYDGGVDGLGPLQVAVETTKADINIARAQNAISENGARPSMLVTIANQLDDTDYDRILEALIRNYAGVANAGKIMLLDNSQEAKVAPYQLTPRELEWVKEHAAHAKDICAAFQVPPVVAGDYSESSILANAGAAHRFFWELWVLPELELWEDTLNWQLLWAEDWGNGVGWEASQGFYLKHDTSNVAALREDENSRATRAMQLFTSGATINQTLEMRGLPPIDDPRGDVILVPKNLLPLDAILQTAPQEVQHDSEVIDDEEAGDSSASTALNLENPRAREQNKDRQWRNGTYVPKGPPAQSVQMNVPQNVAPASVDVPLGSKPGFGKALSLEARTDLRRWKDVAKKSIDRALNFESKAIPQEIYDSLLGTLTYEPESFRGRVTELLRQGMADDARAVKAAGDDLPDYIIAQETALAVTLVALVRQYYLNRNSDKFYQDFKQALYLAYLSIALYLSQTLSNEEQRALDNALSLQYGYATAFVTSMRDGDISVAQAEARARLYAKTLTAFYYTMQLVSDKKAQYRWEMDPDAEHCADCIELHGQVHPAEYWMANHIPKDGGTECSVGCRCKLVPVNSNE